MRPGIHTSCRPNHYRIYHSRWGLVTNEGTGIVAIRLQTDSSGNYVATALPPGQYSVTVEATGFKRSVNTGIALSVQDRIGVNVTLEVGQVTETVEVSAAAQQLQTDTSYLGQVVESQRIVDLPLNGRFFTRLAILTSATIPTAPALGMNERAASVPMASGLTRTATCSTASTITVVAGPDERIQFCVRTVA